MGVVRSVTSGRIARRRCRVASVTAGGLFVRGCRYVDVVQRWRCPSPPLRHLVRGGAFVPERQVGGPSRCWPCFSQPSRCRQGASWGRSVNGSGPVGSRPRLKCCEVKSVSPVCQRVTSVEPFLFVTPRRSYIDTPFLSMRAPLGRRRCSMREDEADESERRVDIQSPHLGFAHCRIVERKTLAEKQADLRNKMREYQETRPWHRDTCAGLQTTTFGASRSGRVRVA